MSRPSGGVGCVKFDTYLNITFRFVLLKERNMLLTQRAEARATFDRTKFPHPYRLKKVKLSMARIKVRLFLNFFGLFP